ncbi:MAG: hypothetical protein Q9169_004693, partial [Polycauliona sp. 2 TL-2023]
MGKKSKLFTALDAHKKIDYGLQRQKKLQKQAAKHKRFKETNGFFYNGEPVMSGGLQKAENGDQASEKSIDGHVSEQKEGSKQEDAAVYLATQEKTLCTTDSNLQIDPSRIDDSESSSENTADEMQTEQPAANGTPPEQTDPKESEDDAEDSIEGDVEEEGIPLSDIDDLSEEEKGDMIPHQRLTINNTAALTKAYNSIALSIATLPFSEHQTIISSEPITIPDVNDDLPRELAFHKQCLIAAKEGRYKLKKEGIAFSRPADYFAEM